MCGITGICNFPYSVEKLQKKMNLLQDHRGPDSNGYFFDKENNVSFGMTRLAIIGLVSGRQPQFSDDKKIVLIFNGEIFNYKELGKFYFNRNYTSDSKLLVDLYKKFGLNFLSKLNGMFSIAIFDKNKKKVFLVRDRFGIKPLYYCYKNGCLFFSSELKTIVNSINYDLKINNEVSWHYFSLGYCPTNQTIYKEIHKLNAGSYLEFDTYKKKMKFFNWWSPTFTRIQLKKKEDYYDLVLEKLSKAIKSWSVSDVPICFMVSGGLDSSLISSIYSKIINSKINTASLGFRNPELNKWNELHVVQKLVKKIESNHHNIYLDNHDFDEEFEKIIFHLSEPFGGGLPSWYFFKKISKKYKVVISGVGGDELFGNYNRQINYFKKNKYLSKNSFENIYCQQNFTSNESWKKKYLLFGSSKINKTSDIFFNHLLINKKNMCMSKSLSYLDIQGQLQDDFLYLTDRFSMAHSLEVRTPFLDHELVETVYSLPESIRISSKNYKPILKKFAKKMLPKIYHNYPKKGFSLPLSIYMRNNLRLKVEKLLSKKNLNHFGIVDPKFHDDYVVPMLNGNNKAIQLIWNIFMFYSWLESRRIA